MTNTADEARAAELTVSFLDLNDSFKALGEYKTSVGLDAYSGLSLDLSDRITDGTLAVVTVESEGNVYRSYYKTGKLEIEQTDAFEIISKDETSVTVKANTYLQAVELEGDYTFSDNYFTMLPGEKKTVTFEKFSDKANGVSIKSYTLK